MRRRQWRVEAAWANGPLETFVASMLGLAPAVAQRLIRGGAVYVRARRCRVPEFQLAEGMEVTAVLEEGGRDVLEAPGQPPPFRVIFEDDALLVVNKPPGVTAQPTAGRVGDSLLDQASSWLKKPAGLVHRLDRETSGVTVFGKTTAATSALAAQFREGWVEKVYLAVTGPGLGASGEMDLPIGRDPSHPGRQRAQKGAMGKKAFTRFERLTEQPHFCVVRLFPKTGRTHQLRAHLAALGFPILGDRLYHGAPAAGALAAPRCLLHARSLTLAHPTTQAKLTFEAPLFEDMAVFLKAVPGLF